MAQREARIDIYGRSYTIRSEEEEDYILRLADYVDRKMRDVSQRSSVISSLNVSVLAALNIADELFKLREQAQAYDNLAEEKVSNLLNLLEKED
tara:strand:+ start:761 stop:1042 length:282 start_codon:yes stop_codon:yes gene_type:complete